MKRELKSHAAEMKNAAVQVDALVKHLEALVGDDPMQYGQAVEGLRKSFHENGVSPNALNNVFQFTSLQDFREKFLELTKNLNKIELFNHKHADFLIDTAMASEIEEYVLDCRWMLPTIKKVYGENSEQYEAINLFASFDFESVKLEEE